MKFKPELEVGDKIILLHMEGEFMSPGTKGTVTSVERDPFVKQGMIYGVKWENGRTLNLLSVADAWTLDKTEIKEQFDSGKYLHQNADLIKFFDVKKLFNFLSLLRKSGVVNMLAAAPYLYLGRERIAHEFYYNRPANEDEFEEMLDKADEAQYEMINGVTKYLKSKNEEINIDNINRQLKNFSNKMIVYYTIVF
jgi:hypothetical protein